MSEAAQEPLASVPDDPPAPDPEPKAEKQTTSYLVLSQDDSKFWSPAGTYAAASSKAAVSAHVKAKGAQSGTFVAVPERSWNPLTLKVETQPKITLS